jgi:hypothetical protein
MLQSWNRLHCNVILGSNPLQGIWCYTYIVLLLFPWLNWHCCCVGWENCMKNSYLKSTSHIGTYVVRGKVASEVKNSVLSGDIQKSRNIGNPFIYLRKWTSTETNYVHTHTTLYFIFVFICFDRFQIWGSADFNSLENWLAANKKALF